MHRRHFVKLSSTTAAAVLLSRITHAAVNGPIINDPEEVWTQTAAGWVKLKDTGHSTFTFNDVTVNLKPHSNSTGVYVQSQQAALLGVRLKWKYEVKPQVKTLGDEFERLYGDAA